MIITARLAHNLVNQDPKEPKNLKKSELRQLRKIENAIIRKIKKNETSLQYHGSLYKEVSETFIRNGYVIENCCTYDYYLLVIHWDAKS